MLVFPFIAMVVAWLAQEPPTVCDLISALFAHVGSALAIQLSLKCHVILELQENGFIKYAG